MARVRRQPIRIDLRTDSRNRSYQLSTDAERDRTLGKTPIERADRGAQPGRDRDMQSIARPKPDRELIAAPPQQNAREQPGRLSATPLSAG